MLTLKSNDINVSLFVQSPNEIIIHTAVTVLPKLKYLIDALGCRNCSVKQYMLGQVFLYGRNWKQELGQQRCHNVSLIADKGL